MTKAELLQRFAALHDAVRAVVALDPRTLTPLGRVIWQACDALGNLMAARMGEPKCERCGVDCEPTADGSTGVHVCADLADTDKGPVLS